MIRPCWTARSTGRLVLLGLGSSPVYLSFSLFTCSPAGMRCARETLAVRIFVPRQVNYVSAIETKAERERAASAVQEVFTFDPALRSSSDNGSPLRCRPLGRTRQRDHATSTPSGPPCAGTGDGACPRPGDAVAGYGEIATGAASRLYPSRAFRGLQREGDRRASRATSNGVAWPAIRNRLGRRREHLP